MKKDANLYLVVGLLGGILLTVLFSRYSFSSNMTPMMKMMGGRPNLVCNMENQETAQNGMMGKGSSMSEMMGSLNNKSGDDFDRSFIEAMIPHHQGAIEMAKEAQMKASHPELKKLADEIIKAQESEIGLMRKWQENWGL